MRISSKIVGLISLAYGGGDHCNKHVLWALEDDGLATKDHRPDQRLTDKGVGVLAALFDTYAEHTEEPMKLHPEPVENLSVKAIIPWEPLGQIEPKNLPAPSDKYPGPWTYDSRGNGHFDVIDAQGRAFAHVYCWEGADCDALGEAIKASGGEW